MANRAFYTNLSRANVSICDFWNWFWDLTRNDVILWFMFLLFFLFLGSQRRLVAHDWCRIWIEGHKCGWQIDKAPNLGHGRPGALPFGHTKLLSRFVVSTLETLARFCSSALMTFLFHLLQVLRVLCWCTTSQTETRSMPYSPGYRTPGPWPRPTLSSSLSGTSET